MSALRVIAGGRAGGAGSGSPAPSEGARTGGALRELYEKHGPAVYARCKYLLRDPDAAKDAMQEVFVRALRAESEFRGQASPSTWLNRIATHHCLNVLRAEKAQWHGELRRMGEGRQQETEPPERRELLRALLPRAGQEAQEVAIMAYVDEMTQAQIGAALGRSLPTVRKRLREFLAAARAALREALPGVELPEGSDEELP